MLRTRNYDHWMAKQNARHEAMRGWDGHKGEYHGVRRPLKYTSRGMKYARMSFGRRPVPTLK